MGEGKGGEHGGGGMSEKKNSRKWYLRKIFASEMRKTEKYGNIKGEKKKEKGEMDLEEGIKKKKNFGRFSFNFYLGK